MRRVRHPMQQLPVSKKVLMKMSSWISRQKQTFQILQDYERSRRAQVREKKVEALFKRRWHKTKGLSSEDLKTAIEQDLQCWRITKRAKDDHLKVRSLLVHEADCE
jgi:hypothetical protein